MQEPVFLTGAEGVNPCINKKEKAANTDVNIIAKTAASTDMNPIAKTAANTDMNTAVDTDVNTTAKTSMNTAILTIDDISSKNTPAIVDYLNSKGITAVMFAVGQNVEQFYDEAIYALRGGMIVGNHSYTHPAFSSLTLEDAIADIEKNEEVLNKLYKDAGVERVYRPFRFPYGDKGGEIAPALQKYLAEKHFSKLDDTGIPYAYWKECGHDRFIDTFWSFDIEEYRIPWGTDFNVDSVWSKLKDRNPANGEALIGEGKHHIILLHAHDETEAIVPEYYKKFIDYMLENGMEFIKPKFL